MAKILIVDDKPLNRSVLATLLSYKGHHTLEASSGIEALHQMEVENPELIITDILMPQMDGYEFVRKVRELRTVRQPGIIFYSATYLEGEAQALARACGVSRVICKPCEPDDVLKTVDEELAAINAVGPPTSGNDALGAKIIKILSNKLYHKIQELEEANSELERHVAKRTAELERTNLSLQEQISQREKAQSEAARTNEERLKMKSDLLSHVSHELRSPLAVVHQFTTILLDGLGGPLNSDQREYLVIALRNLDQLKHMIDDLLEASRADVGKLTVHRSCVRVRDVIGQTVKSYQAIAAKKDITLKIDISENLPHVYADPARLTQIVANLLDNAVKFSPPNDMITIRAVRFEEDPKYVACSVADGGPGIDPAHADPIFDRLYQVGPSSDDRRGGLGLGLYICKELVSLHGGSIWLDKEVKFGTVFKFSLPIFSIPSMVTPILVTGGNLAPSVALITIKVRPIRKWPDESYRERALHKIQQLLDRCVLPDADVLLPVESIDETSSLFGIVARADKAGASVMLSRIRDQLSRHDPSNESQLICSVDSEVMDTTKCGGGLSLAERVATIVHHLGGRLKAVRSEKDANEQKQNTYC